MVSCADGSANPAQLLAVPIQRRQYSVAFVFSHPVATVPILLGESVPQFLSGGRVAGMLCVLAANATKAPAQQDMSERKIDPPLLTAMRAGRTSRVIVMGKTQLFAPVGPTRTIRKGARRR